MMRLRNFSLLWIPILLTLGTAAATVAQQQEPPPPPPRTSEPIPPIAPVMGDSRSDNGDQSSNVQFLQTPPTSAVQAGLTMPVNRSYLLPAVAYYGQVDTNVFNVSNSSNYSLATLHSLLGTIVLQRLGSHSQFDAGYLGGQSFSNHGGLNSTTQELGVSQSWNYAHWSALLADQFSYSSENSLLGGTTPYALAGIDQVIGQASLSPAVLNNTFVPNQTIFTAFGPRLSNAGVAEMDYRFTGRTILTAAGNYNTLHLFNNDLVDSSAAGVQVGINYLWTRKDTIGIAYRFNDLWFSGFPDRIRDHLVEALYERQLSRRLSARVGAGPEISDIIGAGVQQTRASWAAQASVRYLYERTSIGLSYHRQLSGGSGVFLGSVTDAVSLGVEHTLSRLWYVSAGASYARNTNLLPVQTATIVAPAGARFNSGYGGFTVHRRLGWQTEAFAGYTYRHQTSNISVCQVGVCGTDLTGHLVNFGFLWRPERIAID